MLPPVAALHPRPFPAGCRESCSKARHGAPAQILGKVEIDDVEARGKTTMSGLRPRLATQLVKSSANQPTASNGLPRGGFHAREAVGDRILVEGRVALRGHFPYDHKHPYGMEGLIWFSAAIWFSALGEHPSQLHRGPTCPMLSRCLTQTFPMSMGPVGPL